MTDIEQKALALVNEVRFKYKYKSLRTLFLGRNFVENEALCRAIEQHETFRQEVSDVVYHYVYADGGPDDWEKLTALIIPKPKPDPLVEIIGEINDGPYVETKAEYADRIRAALDARGLEIREKGR